MPFAPSAALKQRHQNVRARLAERSLDALVVTTLPNVLYLTNFSGSSAIVVLTADRLYFVTDFRYVAAISEMRGQPDECPGLELVTVESSYDETLAQVLAGLKPRTTTAGAGLEPRTTDGAVRVGFEGANLTVARHEWLRRRLDGGPTFATTEGLVESARVTKDAYELGVLREAGRRLSRVAAELAADVRKGRTELEVALDIDWRIRRAGFTKTAFDTIVAAGPNGALPHAHPTDRKLSEGDLVVLDFGGVWDSYCVDLTRTVSIGPAGDRARAVYAAVLKAHDRAIQAIRPGVSRFAIDGAARESLGEDGMADAFGHGTGHGLGIEVHEDPRIGRRRPDADPDDAVTADMVFTVEPGAYFPGWGGVRIEDDVLVTKTGAELLTHVTTDLLEL
ncbi:MAG TPA: Xaa-Pro peptidase family protein [Vicinamibacterales bacterium]|nr:Xaa-Pro peptidase family protein [Vicinamibacterales bacterium]